jgi:hypothetical protein
MEKKKVLLVEGVNDKHVINNLLKIHNSELAEEVTIRDKQGITNILETLKIEVDANQDFLGIVVDANASLDSRWQSITNRLKEIGYAKISENPVKNGLILESENFLPKLGIWVMPNNELVGKIENFIRLLVAQEKEPLWKIVEKSVDEIPNEHRLFAEKDLIKAQIHTFLAWQDEPGRPMGESITRRYFQPNAPQAQNFVNWLKRLFVE